MWGSDMSASPARLKMSARLSVVCSGDTWQSAHLARRAYRRELLVLGQSTTPSLEQLAMLEAVHSRHSPPFPFVE